MKCLLVLLLLAARCAMAGTPRGTVVEQVNTGTNAQQIEGQRVFHSGSSVPDSPIVAQSENGASAAVFTQGPHFTSAVFTVSRTGTAGCPVATTPAFEVTTGQETRIGPN